MTYNAFQNMTLGELLSVQAGRFSNQIFLRLDRERWTYADVELQAARLNTIRAANRVSPGRQGGPGKEE